MLKSSMYLSVTLSHWDPFSRSQKGAPGRAAQGLIVTVLLINTWHKTAKNICRLDFKLIFIIFCGSAILFQLFIQLLNTLRMGLQLTLINQETKDNSKQIRLQITLTLFNAFQRIINISQSCLPLIHRIKGNTWKEVKNSLIFSSLIWY